MKKFISFMALLSLAVWLAGCSGSTTATVSSAPAATNEPAYPKEPTEAQPKLQTMKLWLGSQEMVTELAMTPLQQQTGMMFRTNMGPNEGMLFPFGEPVQASFWMLNTILPLSAAYIAPDGTILEIHDLKPHDTNAVVAATANVQYVLEAPKDWFKTNNIGVGTLVKTEYGPLKSVFIPGK